MNLTPITPTETMVFNTRCCGVCMSRKVQDPTRCTNIYHFPPPGFEALNYPPHWGNWQRPLRARASTFESLNLKTEEMAEIPLKEINESLPKNKEEVVHEDFTELLKGNPELKACFANWKARDAAQARDTAQARDAAQARDTAQAQDAALPDMAGRVVPETSTPALFGKWSAFFPCDWKLEPHLKKPSSSE